MKTDRRIGVLMGGDSAEREVSLRSGAAVYNALKAEGYDVVAIDAGRDICEALRRERVDVAFLALHGGTGENGAIQGLLEVLGIPYTGSGILASALAMDKEATKKVFCYHGIPVAPFGIIRRPPAAAGRPASIAELRTLNAELSFGLPWVVKPSAEGSSIGVNIVRDEAELSQALVEAFSYGDRVIIEQYIEGAEVQIGILNGRNLGAVEVRPKVGFYSYEAKYTPGLTEYILPPEIDPEVLDRAGCVAVSAHEALGCSGATRVDLIIDPSGNPYVLEVNTIPGMTETSLLPKIASLAGLDFPALIREILGEVLG